MPVTKPTEIMLHEANVEMPKESIADLVRKMIALLGEDRTAKDSGRLRSGSKKR